MNDRKKYKIIKYKSEVTQFGEKRYWLSVEERGDLLCFNESRWLRDIEAGFVYADEIEF